MSAKCRNPECNKTPSYNFINETIKLYCKEHKLVDMVNIKKKKCNNPG